MMKDFSFPGTTTKCSTLPLPQGRPMALSSGALSSAGNSFETTASSIPQQLSTESNDSRIYLTSSEVRDPYSATLVVPSRRRQRPQDDGNVLSFWSRTCIVAYINSSHEPQKLTASLPLLFYQKTGAWVPKIKDTSVLIV